MKIVALDVGGTAIKSGLYSEQGFCELKETPTNAKTSPIFDSIVAVITSYHDYDAIAISTAGQVHPIDGYIIYANENIPNYTGCQLKQRLQALFSVPVVVENDVNAMALGEVHFGQGDVQETVLCLTYGTGIGGAIVQNKQLYYGSAFSAGEFGALIVRADAHQNYYDGCYEQYASTTALVRAASKLDPKYTNGKLIFNHLTEPAVQAVVDGWIDEVLFGLISLIHLFNPHRIILGGGVMKQDYVLTSLQQKLPQRVMPNYRNVVLQAAKLGNQAGLYGAVARQLTECSTNERTETTNEKH